MSKSCHPKDKTQIEFHHVHITKYVYLLAEILNGSVFDIDSAFMQSTDTEDKIFEI